MCEFIGAGFKEGVNKNVVNILRSLVEDKDCVAYIPYNYVLAKEGRSKDPKVHFPPKESGRPVAIIDMLAHKERFNFSVRCLADVKVEVEEEGRTLFRDMKVWRSYNIIRDGKLVIDHIAAKLSKEAWQVLLDGGDTLYFDDCRPVYENDDYLPDHVYTIKFRNVDEDCPDNNFEIPLLSPNWARPNKLSFHHMLLEAGRLREQVKQAKKYLKENNIPQKSSSGNDVYKENISFYGNKKGETAPAVTYTILENPGFKPAKFESSNPADALYEMNNRIADLDFKCACIKWALETATKKNSYEWSDKFQKKAGSSKTYQEAIVDIDGTSYRLERCEFSVSI